MSDIKHTWSVDLEKAKNDTVISGEHGNVIALVMDEKHANLIAAAPEMLEALKSLLQQVEYMGAPESHPDIIAARAAIQKATAK